MKHALCYLPEKGLQDLDHLLPLAIELDLPVVTHSLEKYDLAKKYYPNACISYIPPYEVIQELATLPVVISTLPKLELSLDLFLEEKLYGKIESIFCHHGLSDKQLLGNQFKNLHADQKTLIYGEKCKREIPSHLRAFSTGNYRLHHFRACQEEYLKRVKPHFKKFDPTKWTVFFAPSWIANNLSYGFTPELLGKLLENSLLSSIPEEIQVIFKPHPDLVKQIPQTLLKIKKAAKKLSNLLYLEEIPYIYPIFEKADCYLGEVSSIGYDFLTTLKPIFTLAKDVNSPLQKIALKAPLQESTIDFLQLKEQSKLWDPKEANQLLKESFEDALPLHKRKKDFFEFI